MAERKPNPLQLARLAMAGAVLAATTFPLTWVRVSLLQTAGHGLASVTWSYSLRFAAYLSPLVIGFSMNFWAESRLKCGIFAELWTEAELDPVRRLVHKPVWTWFSLALTAFCVYLIIFRNEFSLGSFFIILILPSQTAMRIRQLLTPAVVSAGGLCDWQNSKPIRSEHWGEARQDGDTSIA